MRCPPRRVPSIATVLPRRCEAHCGDRPWARVPRSVRLISKDMCLGCSYCCTQDVAAPRDKLRLRARVRQQPPLARRSLMLTYRVGSRLIHVSLALTRQHHMSFSRHPCKTRLHQQLVLLLKTCPKHGRTPRHHKMVRPRTTS